MVYDLLVLPLREFFAALNAGERSVLYALLAVAVALGFWLGRRGRTSGSGFRRFGAWRFPSFQNSGEELVSRVLRAHFRAPDYHLMNHVTLRMEDGTTQVDHILLSRFGVFVIETKEYSGWIYASESDAKWTQVHYRLKHRFQNPIRQNFRHIVAVRDVIDFVPHDAIHSLVVFCGSAEFKTAVPTGVVHVDQMVAFLKAFQAETISVNRMQYAVGRIETSRLALSGQTDVEHVESVRRRLGREAV